MARGVPPGSGPPDRSDPLEGLASLGDPTRRGRTRGVANEGGLAALGDQVERRGGRRPLRRRLRRRRVFAILGALVLLAVVVAGAGYGYFRYEWGKVKQVSCGACAQAATSVAPFNVLLVGSDTRAGDTGQAAKSFGSSALVAGQRSDTIKILHVDPKAGTAALLSIPRDTWVQVSGLPSSSDLSGAQKINTAFNDGPVPLVETIENSFGIPISHFVIIDFDGLIRGVQSVGGIKLNFPYPVRDDDNGNNNSGLYIPTAGCQTLNGNQTLALARSRYFQYYDPSAGGWTSDPSSDIGRIQRQNEIIEALMDKVESTYNPLTLRSFLDSVVHDITIDNKLGPGLLFDLANRYHAFSPSKLDAQTLPTTPQTTSSGDDVEVVQEPAAQQLLAGFLGTVPSPKTPPLDAYDNPLTVPTVSVPAAPTAHGTVAPTTTPAPALPPFDPVPC
ncbi:MAG: LCP family protein [Acidimicrobiales bacterium]